MLWQYWIYRISHFSFFVFALFCFVFLFLFFAKNILHHDYMPELQLELQQLIN